jgi:3'(2'), 5'-bisphosphate nucleotidase
VSDDALEAMIAIARRAAARVAEIYAEHVTSSIEVELKGPGDPVTRADKEANDLIVGALAARFPDAAIIAEETPPTREDLLRMGMGGVAFFVDPLDGTREFVEKNGEFCTMIGMSFDGKAEAGVVALLDQRVFAGRVGAPAFIDSDGVREERTVTRCDSFREARMMVSRSHRPALIDPLCRRLGITRLEPCGSVGVKIARLIEGRAELYVHQGPGMKRWDSCGPEALLRAAGGRLSDLDGHPIDYCDEHLALERGLCASNGVLHPGVLSAVSWAERHV